MDTVPGIIPVRVDGDYIYGRGASDAKAPLIAMLLGASDFPKQNGTIIFAGVVDEEGNATGIKNLVKDKNLIPIMQFLVSQVELIILLYLIKVV